MSSKALNFNTVREFPFYFDGKSYIQQEQES